MFRWWFSITKGWQQRHALKGFLDSKDKQIQTLEEITPAMLEACGVAVLVLDVDGVLCAHGADRPADEVEVWLRHLASNVGEQRIAILTNKPKASRLAYFATHFPSIYVAHSTKKKPFPDGLIEIAQYKGIAPHRLMLVDDRLLTGMLASCMAYTQARYFPSPRRNVWRRPLQECFFSVLRVGERLFFRCFG